MIHENAKRNLSAAKSRHVARHPKILESLLREQAFHPKKLETFVSFLKDLPELDKSSKSHLKRSPRTFDTPSRILVYMNSNGLATLAAEQESDGHINTESNGPRNVVSGVALRGCLRTYCFHILGFTLVPKHKVSINGPMNG